MYETEIAILPVTKETKHQKYNRSAKGKARDYRRYKKRLQNRIIGKITQILILEAELKELYAQEIRYRNAKGETYEANSWPSTTTEIYRSGRVN